MKLIAGMKAADITGANFDKSAILTDLLASEWAGDHKQILGELQFAFVGFVLGESMKCFEHWKRLILLLCSSEKACSTHQDLYLDFIGTFASAPVVTFYNQLKQLPDDFFVDALTAQSFLKVALQNLHEFFLDAAVPPKLRQRSAKFFQLLQQMFKFNPSRENDLQK
jgi:A1 cistron-splicing factor AAR2